MSNTLRDELSESELTCFGLDRTHGDAWLLADESESGLGGLGDVKGKDTSGSPIETDRDLPLGLLASNDNGGASITFDANEPQGWASQLPLWEWPEQQGVPHSLATVILPAPFNSDI
jgi:hypothetical protein